MDDDDLRRGRPTSHKVYGEAIALLAGDALLTHAFGVAAGNDYVSPEIRARAVKLISHGAGCFGMIGGQVLDMLGEDVPHGFELLEKMHSMKTGALISLSAELGALAAGVTDSEVISAVRTYAKNIGLAFQIIDDILDATGDEATLGESVGTDEKENKTTFLTFMSEAEAREYAEELTDNAKAAVSGIAGCDTLLLLADYLLQRNK
jgi:geranylgeranyl diphosphate synthase type II